ncbi:PQQ-dependent sugar dehydrogenase [Planctomycetales bacterium ZRK34]|nr:PQQ-dependent sugar dehydrogenase [Planctomycetales bacterium ZRK34]
MKTLFLHGVLALGLAMNVLAAEPVMDPYPDRIEKGPLRIELQKIAEGIGGPVWLEGPRDGSGRLFVVDQAGKLLMIKDGKLLEKPVLDVTDRLVELRKGFDERGFLGFALHPDFAVKGAKGYGRVYTYISEPYAEGKADFPLKDMPIPPDNQTVIAEYRMDPNADVIDPSTRRELIRADEPQWNHDGGAIIFGPDKFMYLGVGDGGAGNDVGPGHTPGIGNGQDINKFLAKIHRIDPLGERGVKSANGQYSCPEDNPFVGREGLDEIYAYGLRNAWRISFTPDGRLIAGDVGQDMIEEVNIIVRGGNYGWHLKEGPFFFKPGTAPRENIFTDPIEGIEVPDDLIDPIIAYDQDEGTSVLGGYVYQGKALPQLRGLYVFGDWAYAQRKKQPNGKTKVERFGGRLFYMDLDEKPLVIREFRLGKDDRALPVLINSFSEGPDGELYILTNTQPHPFTNQGEVWKIVPVE